MTRPPRIHTDLGHIREALAAADATSPWAAAKRYNMHPKTLYRWRAMRDRNGPSWPTDEDIAEWRRDDAEKAAQRARAAAVSHEYRKRVYLNRGPVSVDSLGVARRLQSLLALGWTLEEIGERMGVCQQRVSHLMRQRYPVLIPATVAQVTRVYDQLHLTKPPPKRSGCNVDLRARTIRMAASRGYVAPAMWENIDDPGERPSRARPWNEPGRSRDHLDHAVVQRILDGDNLTATRAERLEVLRRWLKSGRPVKPLLQRMGWNDRDIPAARALGEAS